jgi:formyltetrahydrofolate deformylase
MTTPAPASAASGSEQLILTLSCPDQPGIVHAVSGVVTGVDGNIIQSQQFGDPDSGLFFMRVEADSPAGRGPVEAGMAEVGSRFGGTWRVEESGRPLRTVVMVSREGHCLTDLLYRQRSQGLPIDVVAVVGNHPDLAPVAQFYGVPFLLVPVTKDTRQRAEGELLDLVRAERVELIVLARYMQVLSPAVCEEMAGRVINIHHSFLPSFKGARPYAQAHERGVKLIGATAHYVTPDLDEGPIIEQDVARVTHADSTADMVALGQDVERRVLAQAVRWHCEHRVLMDGSRTVVFSR